MEYDTSFVMTIGGEPVQGAARFSVVNPANGQVFAEAPDCSEHELDQAIANARAALGPWKVMKLAERQKRVIELADRIAANRRELAALLVREHGKPMTDALGDVMGGVYWLKAYARMDIPAEIVEDSSSRRVEVHRVPIGVVAALAPWNFPVMMMAMKTAPALVTGNTVVLKPSPFTPLTTLRIGELAAAILPPGVLNVISGGDRLGPWMTSHPGIDKISFTGSSATGRRVMASAATGLKRVTLELGGNDAAIVLPDVDVDAVAKEIFSAAFGNSGQICIAPKRIYIHADIYDRFAAALAGLVRGATMGDGAEPGTSFGPIQNRPQFDRVVDLIKDCKAQGYSFLAGGEIPDGPGYFVPLTLVDNPPETARIVTEEQFGPVLPLLKFLDVSDVIRRANDSEYGLGGQIWSADTDTAVAIASQLETGNVWINQGQMIYPHVPFGGHKMSGIGVESSLEGLLAFTNTQTVVVNRRPVVAT